MRDMDYDKYTTMLEKHGYDQIGNGAWSTIFARPGANRVIKVCRHKADRWPEYILWATENGFLGKEAPMVYSIHRMGPIYSASMERLQQLPLKGNALYDELYEHMYFRSREEWKKDVPEEWKSFAKKFTDKFGFGLDLGKMNWMMRGDQLVLTDPLGGASLVNVPRRFSSIQKQCACQVP